MPELPEFSILEKPHLMGRDISEARESFYALAKSRVTFRSQEEHVDFEKRVFGDDWEISSAVYVLSTGSSGEPTNLERWVTGLEISINKDFFGEENKDLISYAIEHEVYEAYLWAKRGYQPQSAHTNHMLARIKQFDMAMRDGKAEKLLTFYKKVNPESASELQYAYDKVKRRHSKRR